MARFVRRTFIASPASLGFAVASARTAADADRWLMRMQKTLDRNQTAAD